MGQKDTLALNARPCLHAYYFADAQVSCTEAVNSPKIRWGTSTVWERVDELERGLGHRHLQHELESNNYGVLLPDNELYI